MRRFSVLSGEEGGAGRRREETGDGRQKGEHGRQRSVVPAWCGRPRCTPRGAFLVRGSEADPLGVAARPSPPTRPARLTLLGRPSPAGMGPVARTRSSRLASPVARTRSLRLASPVAPTRSSRLASPVARTRSSRLRRPLHAPGPRGWRRPLEREVLALRERGRKRKSPRSFDRGPLRRGSSSAHQQMTLLPYPQLGSCRMA